MHFMVSKNIDKFSGKHTCDIMTVEFRYHAVARKILPIAHLHTSEWQIYHFIR